MKTLELTGPALDYAVAVALGEDAEYVLAPDQFVLLHNENGSGLYCYHSNWAIAGPLLDAANIDITLYHTTSPAQYKAELAWAAANPAGGVWWARAYGPDRLTAGLRCLVRSKLGDEVDIPKEITC